MKSSAPQPDAAPPPRLRVASVPSAHPYVAHLGVDVTRLPDPAPPGAAGTGRWWPPVMLSPGWIEAHAGEFDLMHLHFGTESFSAAHLREVLAALRRVGRPLVHTVHDLEHPQLSEGAAHAEHLDVLVPGADALITLTPGAAAEVERRWGCKAKVVPHPHLLGLEVDAPLGDTSESRVVGLHLRDLRPNVDGAGATRALVEAVGALRSSGRDVVARVDLHDPVRDEAAREGVRAACAGVPFVVLDEHPRASEAELHSSIASLDVSLLPYAWGTHSGWLELCWDLGVAVASAEGVGYFGEQHAEVGWFAGYAPNELAGALAELLDAGAAARPGSEARRALVVVRGAERVAQRKRIAAAHAAVYARVAQHT